MMETSSYITIALAFTRSGITGLVCLLIGLFGLDECRSQEMPPVPDDVPTNPLRAEEIPTPPPSGLSLDDSMVDTYGSEIGDSILDGTNEVSMPLDVGGPYADVDSYFPGGPPSPARELLPPPPPGGRQIKLNPLAVPQGVAHLAFSEPAPLSGQRLGFPFSLLPDRLYGHIPSFKLDLGLPDTRSHNQGGPLETGSWRNRPWHFDAFAGGYFPGSVIKDFERPEGTTIVGGRIGWDMGHYLGSELRFGIGEANLPSIQDKLRIRVSDLSWQYYPWGDTALRPYTSLGVGFTNYEYSDAFNVGHGATTFSLPIGIGIKQRMKQWLSFRIEFQDNITFGTGQFSSANNWVLTGTIEFRFGGRRRSYFPFNPGRSGFF